MPHDKQTALALIQDAASKNDLSALSVIVADAEATAQTEVLLSLDASLKRIAESLDTIAAYSMIAARFFRGEIEKEAGFDPFSPEPESSEDDPVATGEDEDAITPGDLAVEVTPSTEPDTSEPAEIVAAESAPEPEPAIEVPDVKPRARRASAVKDEGTQE